MTKNGLSEPKRLNLNKTIVFNEQKSKNKNSMFSLGEAFSNVATVRKSVISELL